MLNVGIDIANSTLKVYSTKGILKYKNTIKELNENGVTHSFKKKYEIFEYNGKKYEVGNNTETGSGARTKNRYKSDYFKLECIFALSKIVDKNDDITLVTGVPSNDANDKDIISEIKNNLTGKYTIYVRNNEDEIITKNINIVSVEVISQPIGTLIDVIYDDNFNIKRPKLLEKQCLIVDIGWGTTDLAVLDKTSVRSTYGFEIGTSDFVLDVQEEINNLYPKLKIFSLTPYELDDYLTNNQTVETAFGEIDARDVVDKFKFIYTKKIYQRIMNLGLDFSRFYNIILCGGGAILLKDKLIEIFDDNRVVVNDNAQLSNAKGFYMYSYL